MSTNLKQVAQQALAALLILREQIRIGKRRVDARQRSLRLLHLRFCRLKLARQRVLRSFRLRRSLLDQRFDLLAAALISWPIRRRVPGWCSVPSSPRTSVGCGPSCA